MTTKEITLQIGESNIKNYIWQSNLGQGSTGVVSLVKEKESGNYIALKVCSLEEKEQQNLFHANAVEMKTTVLDGFVKVRDVGYVEGFPAYTMDYGGSDVNKLYDYIKELPESVREAVSYKIMYAVINSLENAHNKNKFHGDLLTHNILSGSIVSHLKSLPDNAQKNNLLILGQVSLCDRTESKLLGTSLCTPSLSKDYFMRDSYLFDTVAKDNFQRDIYAAIALCSLLIDRENRSSPITDFAKEFFGIDKLGRDRAGNYFYPRLSDLKVKLENVINSEHDHYFKLMPMVNSSTREEFSIVARPIDRFNFVWDAGKIIDLTSLKQFHTNDDNSYISSHKCGGSYHPADEKTLLQHSFSSILEQVVDNTLTNLDENNDVLKPLVESKSKFEKALQEQKSSLSSLTESLHSTDTQRVDLAEKLKGPYDTSLLDQIVAVSREYESFDSQIKSLNRSITGNESTLSSLTNQINILKQAPYKEMLEYINTECLSNVSDECKPNIVKKLKNRIKITTK